MFEPGENLAKGGPLATVGGPPANTQKNVRMVGCGRPHKNPKSPEKFPKNFWKMQITTTYWKLKEY